VRGVLEGTNPLKRTFLAILVLSVVSAGLSCRSSPGKALFTGEGQHILPESRLVELVCAVTVSDIPEKTKEVRLWMPFPTSSRHQRLVEPTIQSPASYRPMIRYDAHYGAPVLFVSAEAPLPKSFDVEYALRVERVRVEHQDMTTNATGPDNQLQERLAADLAPVEDASQSELAKIIGEVAPADNAAFDRARAIYDYVMGALDVDNAVFIPEVTVEVTEAVVRPDPDIGTVAMTAAPSGRSVKEILVARKGNAFDYALLTVALLRSAGIPARIESGVMLPEDKTPDRTELSERHAWVRFYVPGFGWNVCDPYLADRYPELKAYMFGGLCSNRVQLSAGPGPGLVPKPEAGLPTVLAGAVAEADEKPVTVDTHIFFRDVSGGTSP